MNKISIIIPTYNAQEYLPTLLEKIKNQSLKEYELVVIDSSSNDNTVEIAKQFTDNVIVIPQGEFDHGGTRAQVAKIAKGEILVYLTQDALPYDVNAINELIAAFDDNAVGAAYGRQLSYSDTNLFGKHLRLFNYGEESHIRDKSDIDKFGIKTAFLSDSFAAYRKITLESMGWFKDGLILGEDTYVGAKMILAGYKLAYVADARVYHSHSYTIAQEFRRYFDIGVFHRCENWILDDFGKAEGEGLKYIVSELKYLLRNKAFYLVPEFFLRNGMKYFGYMMGYNYEKFPTWLIKRISMHSNWWRRKK